MINLPQKFLTRMQSMLGGEYPNFLLSMQQPDQKAIFVNQNKINPQQFKDIVDFSVKEIGYEPSGFYIEQEKYGRHPLHHAGAFYIQEPSAMFTVNAYNFCGNELVLDMCAAPGGKSIQIANRIPNGVLVANEVVANRCNILYSNVERMGLKNVIITNDKPCNIANAYANTFDVCLVDAPCSGEGMFRRGDQVVDEWNEGLANMCSERQLSILSQADKCLKTGGVIIYSTCTYSKEENEDVVNQFINQFGYQLMDIKAPSYFDRGINLNQAVRLYPHKVKGEGQFVAVMKKISDNDNMPTSTQKLNISSISSKFFAQNVSFNAKIYDFNKFSYYVPDLSLIKKGVKYCSIGVKIGCVKGDRLEPDHYLFSAFGNYFNNNLQLDYRSQEVANYLHGDIINHNLSDGYGAVIVNGCALGGFKISNGQFKNHYPKGLRNFN